MKEFEIRQVANGVMVTPARSMERGLSYDASDVHVFRTWTQASAWIRAQLEGGRKMKDKT